MEDVYVQGGPHDRLSLSLSLSLFGLTSNFSKVVVISRSGAAQEGSTFAFSICQIDQKG